MQFFAEDGCNNPSILISSVEYVMLVSSCYCSCMHDSVLYLFEAYDRANGTTLAATSEVAGTTTIGTSIHCDFAIQIPMSIVMVAHVSLVVHHSCAFVVHRSITMSHCRSRCRLVHVSIVQKRNRQHPRRVLPAAVLTRWILITRPQWPWWLSPSARSSAWWWSGCRPRP